MIYPIVKFGNPVLEKPSEPVTVFDDELKRLVEDMFESMYAAHTQNEGCLSIPEFREPVTRPSKVTVRAQDVSGKWFEKTGDDLLARALLHETDHLHGKLYISHLSILKRDLMKRKIRKLIKAGEW